MPGKPRSFGLTFFRRVAYRIDNNYITIHNGEVVEGTVIRVKEDEIVLNIGYKADGIITRNEYTNTPNVDLRTLVKEGDTMSAKVLKVNDGEGQVLLTYKKLIAEKGNKRLEEAFNNKEVLTAKVSTVLEGGLSVVIEESRVFIPASLVSDTYEKNLEKYKDQEIEFVITEFNPRRRRIIGDRKQLLLAKKRELSGRSHLPSRGLQCLRLPPHCVLSLKTPPIIAQNFLLTCW